jgi:hypothetical protein
MNDRGAPRKPCTSRAGARCHGCGAAIAPDNAQWKEDPGWFEQRIGRLQTVVRWKVPDCAGRNPDY